LLPKGLYLFQIQIQEYTVNQYFIKE
jgi:hypothetical protein